MEPSPARFTAVERPEAWVSTPEVEAIANGDAAGALVCGIPPQEFSGAAGRGHIRGSVNVPAGRLVDRETNTFLPAAELGAMFPDDKRIVTYCNGGIAAAADALALVLAGHTNVALYDGSLNEWASDPARRLVTTMP